MKEHKEPEKIDIAIYLVNFFKTVKKFWAVMGILTAVIAVLFYMRSQASYTPMYQSQVTFTVNMGSSNVLGTGSASIEQLRESLPYILNSRYLKNLVMDDMGLSYFPASVSLESKEFVEFFVLKVTASDPDTAYNVLNSVMENCPKASVYVLGKISFNILDSSGIPAGPVNYLDKRMSLATGLIAGLAVSVALAVIYTLTRRTIGSEEDLKKYLNVSCLATLPMISFKKRRKEFDRHIHIHNARVGHAYLENVRIMRARVQRSMEQLGAKVLLVTSSVPQEGKSTVASNLALSLAEKGARVVLVDLDLRNPSVDKVLGMSQKKSENEGGNQTSGEEGNGSSSAREGGNGSSGKEEGNGSSSAKAGGITAFLSGSKKLEVCKVKKWNIDLLYAGQQQNNPVELLNRHTLGRMIEALKAKYDYVVLDTPPAAMLSDASIIAKHADAAVYVVKQDYARLERISEGMEVLSLSQVPIVGVVLNSVENIIGGYGGYRYGKYGAYGHYADNGDKAMEYVDVMNTWEEEH